MKAYDLIYEVASENYGLMTTDMAREIGVSSMALVMLENEGESFVLDAEFIVLSSSQLQNTTVMQP